MRNEMKSASGGKKIWLGISIVVVLAGGIIGGVIYKKSHAEKNQVAASTVSNPNHIEITAKEGQTALDVLKANTKVDYTDSSSGVLVNSINGITNTSDEFWLYSVNGNEATVAADKYICKNGDVVKWEYKGF